VGGGFRNELGRILALGEALRKSDAQSILQVRKKL
jgi:hypothetical protein